MLKNKAPGLLSIYFIIYDKIYRMADRVDAQLLAQDSLVSDDSLRITMPNLASRLDPIDVDKMRRTLISCELMEKRREPKEKTLFRYWEAMKYFTNKERFHGNEKMVFFKIERSEFSKKELLNNDTRDYYLFFNRESNQLAKVTLQSDEKRGKKFKVVINYFKLDSEGQIVTSSEEKPLSEATLIKVRGIGMFSDFISQHWKI